MHGSMWKHVEACGSMWDPKRAWRYAGESGEQVGEEVGEQKSKQVDYLIADFV